MRTLVLFCLIISLLAILASCGIYQEPCEGVTKININTQNI